MIAQLILSLLLAGILFYAWAEYRRSPTVAILAAFVAMLGLYFVWFPAHSTRLAALVGIGRGADLILYIWVCISVIVILNVHLKLRTQMELLTILAPSVHQEPAGFSHRGGQIGRMQRVRNLLAHHPS
jgi:hypothetical protein